LLDTTWIDVVQINSPTQANPVTRMPGESVDVSFNFTAMGEEILIGKEDLANGTALQATDPWTNIVLYDDGDNTWDPTKDAIILDANGDGAYQLEDTILAGATLVEESQLTTTNPWTNIAFYDAGTAGTWEQASDAIVLDANANAIYDCEETFTLKIINETTTPSTVINSTTLTYAGTNGQSYRKTETLILDAQAPSAKYDVQLLQDSTLLDKEIQAVIVGGPFPDVDVTFTDRTTAGVYIDVVFKTIDQDTLNNTLSLKYGEILTFSVNVPDKATVKLIDLISGDIVWTSTLTGYKEFSLDTLGLGIKPSDYALEVTASYGTATNDFELNNASTFTSVSRELFPESYKLVVELARVNQPIVEIYLKNPSNLIAKGDKVIYDVYIYGATQGKYNVTGPYYYTTLLTAYYDQTFTTTAHKATIEINTTKILEDGDGQVGAYEFKVTSGDTEEKATFYIVDLVVSVSVDKDVVRLGQKLKIYGTTNVAESGGDYDIGDKNTVTITIYNSTAVEDKYKVTTTTADVKAD
jgi:hypothetical protein